MFSGSEMKERFFRGAKGDATGLTRVQEPYCAASRSLATPATHKKRQPQNERRLFTNLVAGQNLFVCQDTVSSGI